jgi:glycine/serine hydroxymethyltransferase
MKEIEMKMIAKIFHEALLHTEDEKILYKLKKEVLELCKNFPIYR